MEKNIIWIDLDEVLAESITYILQYHKNKINGKTVNIEDIKNYYIYEIFDISKDDAIQWFREPTLHDINKLEIKPVQWAKKKLEELKNKWYILKIITARRLDLFWEYTHKWINKYFPEFFDEIIFANYFSENQKNKSEICGENNIEHMIEDNFHYAKELAEQWIKTYLLEKPWNDHISAKHKNIRKVKDWSNITI